MAIFDRIFLLFHIVEFKCIKYTLSVHDNGKTRVDPSDGYLREKRWYNHIEVILKLCYYSILI